jgi:protocatechuate 3,4-dioxygenase beta subunit
MITRRRLIAAAALWPIAPAASGQTKPLTCGVITPRQTEGPFFKPQSPKRTSLVDGKAATLIVTGQVLSTDCKPVVDALLDFWHADEQGEYDNQGFHYRGHQFTDAQGRYRLETIVPAEYPGRARHIHVKVQAPKGRVLTTQLYFPNEPGNRRDGIFRPDLVMQMNDKKQGAFDFVVA